MANIIDYLKWRGDLKLSQAGFNPADNMILCQLSYALWDNIVSERFTDTISMKDAAEQFFIQGADQRLLRDGYFAAESLIEMIGMLKDMPRFNEMRLCGYKCHVDYEHEKQYASITFLLEDGSLFVAYRGTDGSFVGWKEDFNMSFMLTVPSQVEALNYLTDVANAYPYKALRVGGHSKGGNLAVYAGVFLDEAMRDRIVAVYNNDGPGFEETVIQDPRFVQMDEKIHTYVPQSSIVGMILEHEEAYTVVHSKQIGAFQHDGFSWEILGADFVHLEEVTGSSRFLDKTMKEWVKTMSTEQKEKFMDAMYEIITVSGVKTTKEFKTAWFKNGMAVVKSLRNVDEDTKKLIIEGFGMFFKAASENLPKFQLNFPDLPTELRLPWKKKNEETVAALAEAETLLNDSNVKRYSDVEEAIRELRK